MSEGDVSLIRDEDVLRRMWQQTEDFSRKKEIRAHMYRLREERLRNLYSPEPKADGKGCEFTSPQGHVQSFADQTFQSMKSKEVRDAGSPPKEFTYRGQDLKDLSNAGWNVESENRTTDDGHTHVKSVNANIEGRYDVEGGRGQFAAVDQHKQAVTEYHDDNSSLKRNESSSNTAAREQVVRQTDDGTQISSTTSSSTSTSKFQQVSSTKHETVPYLTNDNYDQSQQTRYDTNSNEEYTKVRQPTHDNDYEQNLRKTTIETGELVSRNVDYPDDNTKVIVETRCLPDGTRVTSTRREFRGPAAQNTRSERYSQSHQTRNESISSHSTSQKTSGIRETSSQIIRDSNDNRTRNIVDSQRNVDDLDFKRNQIDYVKSEQDRKDHYQETIQRRTDQQYAENLQSETCNRSDITTIQNKQNTVQHHIKKTESESENLLHFTTPLNIKEHNIQETLYVRDDKDSFPRRSDDVKEIQNKQHVVETNFSERRNVQDNEKLVHITTDQKIEDTIQRKTTSDQHQPTNDHYQTTYQSEFTQNKKISNDWSPTHQAWASTLRADTPTSTRPPSTRGSSPGARTFQSSTSSLRSSVSPDKTYRKPTSRGGSPSKVDRHSPTRTHSTTDVKTNRYTTPEGRPPHVSSPTRPRYSPDRKPHDEYHHRSSASPDKRPYESTRYSASPERKPIYKHSTLDEFKPISPNIQSTDKNPDKFSSSPERMPAYQHPTANAKRPSKSPERKPTYKSSPADGVLKDSSPTRQVDRTTSPDYKPERKSKDDTDVHSKQRTSKSPDRKPTFETTIEKKSKTISPSRLSDRHDIPTRSSYSPDKKPTFQATDLRPTSPVQPIDCETPLQKPNDNPEKTSDTQSRSPHRSSCSPDKKPIRHLTKESSPTRPISDREAFSQMPTSRIDHPRDISPSKHLKTRSSLSPEQTPSGQNPMSHNSPKPKELGQSKSPTRENVIPDRKPSYMKPTAASKYSPSRDLPTSSVSKSPSPEKKYTTPRSPERTLNTNTTKITDDHYKFIDEETKMYTRTDDDNIKITKKQQSPSPRPHRNSHDKSTSPLNKSSQNIISDRPDSPSNIPRSTLRKDSRSPSPPKGPVTFVQNTINKNYEKTYVENELDDHEIVQNIMTQDNIKDSPSLNKKGSPHREPSPSKYGTYDKKQHRSEKIEEKTTTTTEDIKYNSLTRREKSSSPTKTSVSPTLPVKKTQRDSASPLKPVKDDKYKHTTDFISSEITSEEISKPVKNRPRQLITPSTSPSRKPKTNETTSSTGQSSPTTSVSEFVYFSSPKIEKTQVTDLDDGEIDYHFKSEEVTTVHKRPESLDVKRSPSPSKIPCRSPPQEKHGVTDSLPRKSSLKKPSPNINQVSPMELPPSSFQVSPTVETRDLSDKPSPDKTFKSKPPLERRETYDERCRKILGMVDDNTKSKFDSTVTKEILLAKEQQSNTSSASVSPCRSPKEGSPIKELESNDDIVRKTIDVSTIKVTEFSTREQDDILKNCSNTTTNTIKHTIQMRESSPSKIPDKSTSPGNYTQEHSSKPVQKKYTSDDQKNSSIHSISTQKQDSVNRSSQSPDRKPRHQKTTESKSSSSQAVISPSKLTHVSQKELSNTDESQKPVHPLSSQPSSLKKKPSVDSAFSKQKVSSTQDNIRDTPSRTPSPSKKPVYTEDITDFIASEREQEILDRVQKSLRKLSPNRSEKSPSRERSPAKSTTSLQDLDITTCVDESMEITIKSADLYNILEEKNKKVDETSPTKPAKTSVKTKETPISSKPSSRNVSPVKKPTAVSESRNKSRSISPKKHFSTDQPQSLQTTKVSGIKPRESIPSHLTRKPTPANLSPTKVEKTVLTTDLKKITKQNSFSNTTNKTTSSKLIQSMTNKTIEPESKRISMAKNIKQEDLLKRTNLTLRKDLDNGVTRTPSEPSIKPKKASPQRIRSKPEIQVNDISANKSTKQNSLISSKLQKSVIKEPHGRLPSKPKSATALNTSTEEDDVIIDVQQAKSSRENSPDRICPTPVGFMEDVGTPRFPDEVSEPDDAFHRRTHHTINETESIVDDIVEICEDEELFVKKTNIDRVTGSDECLLSVNDKVSKFTNKMENVPKPKDITLQFKDIERKIHSDFMTQNLKSDECLLSVSEKVSKFAKGPRDSKDNKSPSRRIADEYDTHTTYQDDYTKLSVNDKAHLFVETAENINVPKVKPSQKIERPDLTDVDDALKRDDCLLSVSDKVHKFVKTAEQFLSDSHNVEERNEKFIKEDDKLRKSITEAVKEEITRNNTSTKETEIMEDVLKEKKIVDHRKDNVPSFAKETTSSHGKLKDISSPNLKPLDKIPTVKITTLRSSEAVKKAKALFENIATTQQKPKDPSHLKTAKLTDIGVIKKSPKTDSTVVLHPSLEDGSPNVTDVDSEVDTAPHLSDSKNRPSSLTPTRSLYPNKDYDERPRSPNYLGTQSLAPVRTSSPTRRTVESSTTITKTVLSRYPSDHRAESPNLSRGDHDKVEKSQDKVPGYQRPTKTSQKKEETKVVEETEVSSRRGSGKFGVELRRTSVERSTVSSERRRSVEHHQPCIEDIFDLDLLEQMLEKVVGYEQRRRIRAQIRIAKKKIDTRHVADSHTRVTKQVVTSKYKSPDRHIQSKSPERKPKTVSPDRYSKTTAHKSLPVDDMYQPKETNLKPILNGHSNDIPRTQSDKHKRPQSPTKPVLKSTPGTKSPARHMSPEKKTRPLSPSKSSTPKSKQNRFNEYASAYMKKVGLNETDKLKFTESKSKKSTETEDDKCVRHIEEYKSAETKHSSSSISHTVTERTSSKDTIEIVNINGKRTPSPEKKRSPDRLYEASVDTEIIKQRSPSPVLKRQKSDTNKETRTKTVYDVEKKKQPKQSQEEKPSWVTNRNLKKVTSETRTFSSRKVEPEKPKCRAPSPSKAITKPIDVITSSYGPGPLDEDGKPLFGIKALRNGAGNYQVKGTVIRQEFHSRNGGAPEGTVSVTAYSNCPEPLERLLQTQGERPARLHGLQAITTTKKFGGDTGTTYKDVHTKEERAALEQFTHQDRKVISSRQASDNTMDSSFERQERVTESRREDRLRGQHLEERRERTVKRTEDKKTVRQSSVKSLTEKYIKSASETTKSERSSYPKAGLILRTASMKDSVSSDSSAHAGLARTDSSHSLGSVEECTTVTTSEGREGRTLTTSTTRSSHHDQRSFLDSTTKVSGVQDILTRMKNADIVIQEGDSSEDAEARALLNKFLGATVLMAGMQNYVTEKPSGKLLVKQETVRSSGGKTTTNRSVEEIDLDQCWDERVLRKLLDECSDYEQRRRLRARIRTLMAEQEACASAVTEALAAAGEATERNDNGEAREEEEVTTVSSSVRRNSSEKTVSSSTTTTTKTSKVTESARGPKPVSPFAKFRQLEKQNSTNSPNSPKTPQSPGSPSAPYFKFTDPAVHASALTIKERLLQWCRDKTRDYENVKLENFSTSWADGLAFCALVHHFLPNTFDYSKLTPDKRRHNFTLAFKVADEKAGIYPLLDVDDMVAMRKPDWKCVFTYVQSIHRRFKDQD